MNEKKLSILFYFAAYVMLMGITGFIRTSAMMPLYLNGSIAIITTLFAFMYSKKSFWYYIVLTWIGLNFLIYSYMTLFGVSAHPNPTVGTYLIFGTMAIFSGFALLKICNDKKSKQT